MDPSRRDTLVLGLASAAGLAPPDTHSGVVKWVKNERLGFVIPYGSRGLTAR